MVKQEKEDKRSVVPLSELQPGGKGQIAYLQAKGKVQMQKLLSIGAIPGMNVVLVQRFPSYVFKLGHTQFAIDKELARSVYVKITK